MIYSSVGVSALPDTVQIPSSSCYYIRQLIYMYIYLLKAKLLACMHACTFIYQIYILHIFHSLNLLHWHRSLIVCVIYCVIVSNFWNIYKKRRKLKRPFSTATIFTHIVKPVVLLPLILRDLTEFLSDTHWPRPCHYCKNRMLILFRLVLASSLHAFLCSYHREVNGSCSRRT